MLPPTRLFVHYLDRLQGLLERVGASGADVAHQRLHPDVFPLLQQAATAIGFTLRATCPLAGRAIVSFANGDTTLDGVLVQLAATRRYLASIPDDEFAGMAGLQVDTTAGHADLRLPGEDYYLMYAVPNFFFHYCMVYAIARQAGVPVGKADFDGFHDYPPGFAFPSAT